MNEKFENFIILFNIFFGLLLLYLIFIRKLLLGDTEGIPFDFPAIFLILLIGFVASITFFWNKPINKDNKKWCRISSIILFSVFVILLLFLILSLSAQKLAIIFDSEIICKIDFDKNNCIKSLAIYKTDEFICEKIIDKEFLEGSGRKAQCYWKIAIAKSNLFLCEKAGNFKENCIVAINNN